MANATVNANDVKLRMQPGTYGIGYYEKLKKNTRVTVGALVPDIDEGDAQMWYPTTFRSYSGYVMKQFITKD